MVNHKMTDPDTIKKLYKYIDDRDTDNLRVEIEKLKSDGVYIDETLTAINSAWKILGVRPGSVDVHTALLCENAANRCDETLITNILMVDMLWAMFYINGDLKYINLIKKVARSDTHNIIIKGSLKWLYQYEQCGCCKKVI